MPVDSVHTEYAMRAPEWRIMRDVIAGERRVKAATTRYLPRLSGMNDMDYAAYLAVARFYPATARTVQGLLGAENRVAPVTVVPPAMESWLRDIDLGGTAWNTLLKTAMEEKLITGRYGFRVDMRPGSPRPYIVGYASENITNWRWDIVRGMRMLVLVVLAEVEENYTKDEFEPELIDIRDVLDLYSGVCRLRRFRRVNRGIPLSPGRDDWVEVAVEFQPTRNGVPLDFIPFVPDGEMECEKPPLLDVASVNLGHYVTTADYYDAMRYSSKPQPYVVGLDTDDEETFRVGSRIAWKLPAGCTANYLEYSGAGIGDIRTSLQDDEGRMARLGAAVIEEPKEGVESEATARINQSGKTSVLSTLATTTSQAASAALRMLAYWGGLTNDWTDPNILSTVNQDFIDTRMTPAELESLVRSWQAHGISQETYLYNVQRGGLLPEGRTVQDEMIAISQEKAEAQAEFDRRAALSQANQITGPGDTRDQTQKDEAA